MSGLTSPEAFEVLREVDARLDKLWELPRDMTVIEWGRANVFLTTGNRKGNWEPDPYQVELLEAATDPEVRRVTMMKPAQIGWTLLCQIIEGFNVEHLANPVLHVLPSADTAAKFGKDRLEPMIEGCPALKSLLVRPTAKNPGSTTRHKVFRNGGSIFLASAGNPRELRGFQAAVMIFDERSGWKIELDGEGDPARIAEARGKTYAGLKIFEGSTPGALPSGFDPTEKGFLRGSQGRWMVPCPMCGMLQRLVWQDRETGVYRLVFERQGARGREVVPGSVGYKCAGCEKVIEERHKWDMAQAGSYEHAFPERRAHRSFHMTALSSISGDPWEILAQQWLDAQDDQSELKTFVTLNLGEAWEDQSDSVNPDTMRNRADAEVRPRGQIPEGVGILTAFVDVQGEGAGKDGYLFATVMGWGVDNEGWIIDWTTIHGDIGTPEPWAALDAWLLEPRTHATSGKVMRPAITLVDAGSGGHSDAVYAFVAPRQNPSRRVFASKGVGVLDRPGLVKESATRKQTIKLYLISNAAWKQKAFGMLQRQHPGPGFVHLADWLTDEFLEQLTAESYVTLQDPKTKRVHGEWRKNRVRNEAWDCLGGCLAGLWTMQNLISPNSMRDMGLLVAIASKPAVPGDAPIGATPGRRVRSEGVR